MTPAAFLESLENEQRAFLDELGRKSAAPSAGPAPAIPDLLKLALRNEYEAADLAAWWMTTTPELDAKLALARQCGDEAKHYRWIEERLRILGIDAEHSDPVAPGPSAMLEYLRGLEGTVARAAAGQFTREAIALVRNDVFATFCEEQGDRETAALYRDRIQPDERHHHELGRKLLLKYAISTALQEQAREAARRTLEIADELQELARLRAGICRAPGC